MRLSDVYNEIKYPLKNYTKCGTISFGTLYDPVQNLVIRVDYDIDSYEYKDIKEILREKVKAKYFRKVKNNICFYVAGIEDLPSYARK